MSTLEDWADALCAELGLERDEAALRAVLDVTKVVAHEVARPAAPLTAYYLGAAVGGGQSLAEAAARIERLAAGFQAGRDRTVSGTVTDASGRAGE